MLLELAAKCEAASGPSREIDLALDLKARPQQWSVSAVEHGLDCPLSWFDASELPEYTTSLDAASKLVPQGWDWCAGTERNAGGGHAYLRHVQIRTKEAEADATTPALALCAAALKALARTEMEEGL